FVEQQRVIYLPVGKRLGTGFAGVGAGLDVPFVHEIGAALSRLPPNAQSESLPPMLSPGSAGVSPASEMICCKSRAGGTPALPRPARPAKKLAPNAEFQQTG